jgi:hypothetical protein
MEEGPVRAVAASDKEGVAAAIADAEVVALIDSGVLPLPGCFWAARSTLAQREDAGGVAVKLFAADGSLEGAGATLFSDGSHCGTARGSPDVDAPWHDFARPTCWGLGLSFFRKRIVLDMLEGAEPVTHESWAAASWSQRAQVLYQPAAAAVRSLAPGPEHGVSALWSNRLASRPRRPAALSESAWRDLIVGDDVPKCWS